MYHVNRREKRQKRRSWETRSLLWWRPLAPLVDSHRALITDSLTPDSSGLAHWFGKKGSARPYSLETCSGGKRAHLQEQEPDTKRRHYRTCSPTERASRACLAQHPWAHFMEIYKWQDLHAAGCSGHLQGSLLWNMARGMRGAHLLVLLCTFSGTLFRDAHGQGTSSGLRSLSLNPPYFNLADVSGISATATCGQDETGTPTNDLYCKLVGGPNNGPPTQVNWKAFGPLVKREYPHHADWGITL